MGSIYSGMSNDQIVKTILLNRTTKTLAGCNEMNGSICKNGYAKIKVLGINDWAHRMIYRLLNGEINSSHDICHKCDNRKCINPDHLFSGTRLENMQDAVKKGRQARGMKMPHAVLDDEKKQRIKEAALTGAKYKDIAPEFNISKSHAGYIARCQGVRRHGIS